MAMSSMPGGSDDDLVPLADINITPFVDVVLVLLIIFMVAAPLMTTAVPVDLPKMTEAKTPQPQEPLVVSIDKDGAVWIEREKMADRDALAAQLAGRHQQAPDRAISLRGDRGVVYGRLMEVMDAIQASGFIKVSLATEAKGG